PRTTARICKVSKYQIAHPSQRKTGSHRSKWENADAKKQGGKKKNLCPRQYAYCCLRAGGQERSQAWREGVHRRDQAAGWSAARSCVAGRSGWCNATDVITWATRCVRSYIDSPPTLLSRSLPAFCFWLGQRSIS